VKKERELAYKMERELNKLRMQIAEKKKYRLLKTKSRTNRSYSRCW